MTAPFKGVLQTCLFNHLHRLYAVTAALRVVLRSEDDTPMAEEGRISGVGRWEI